MPQFTKAFRAHSKLLATLAVCAALIGASYLAGSAARPTPARSVASEQATTENTTSFEPPLIDLGDQAWQQKIPFKLHFVNRGLNNIVAESAQSSCGCTVVSTEVAGRVVEFRSDSDQFLGAEASSAPWLSLASVASPGGTNILVGIDRQWLSEGQNTANVMVRCSSAAKPAGVIYAKARGVYELMSNPHNVRLSRSQPQQRVRIWARDGSDVRLAATTDRFELLHTRLGSPDTIEIQATESARGEFEEIMTVQDERGRTGRVRVFFSGDMQ